jgi:hypothetical protein
VTPLDRSASEEYTYYRKIGGLRLYLDDVEDIVALLKRAGAMQVVLCAGPGIAEDGAEDLRSATSKELRSVSVQSFNPDLIVNLSLLNGFVATTNRKKATRAIVDDVYGLLAMQRRSFVLPATPVIAAGAFLVALILCAPYFITTMRDPKEILWQILVNGIYIIGGLLIVGWLSIKALTGKFIVVIRQWRRDRLMLINDIKKDTWKVLLPVVLAALGFIAKTILDSWSIVWKR